MFLNYIAPLGQLGYGVAGYNILKALYLAGHKVSYFPIGKPEWSGDPRANEIVNVAINNGALYDSEAPCVRLWHQHDLAMFVGSGPRVGFPIFELDKFNEREMHHLSSLDHLFVCSEWAKNIIKSNNIDISVDVIPLGIDPEVFYVDSGARANRPWWTRNKTVFLNIGKWEVRKGHNELCEAFSKAFTKDDDVELWMLNHNPFIGKENEVWKHKYISSSMGEKIKILPRVNSQHEIRVLLNQSDVFVAPAHAEGFNLEPLEAMACGTQVIATNYSGHTEYLNNDNAFLIEPNGMELAQDGKWFHGQGSWCTFNIDDLVDRLRETHKLRQSGSFNKNVTDFAAKFTWTNTASKIVECLSEL